jgi:beta-barrel assembly-enhancing protease
MSFACRSVIFLLSFTSILVSAQDLPGLSVDDEIRAGNALLASFAKSQGFADTPQSKRLEQYLQQVGDKVAAHAKRKLPYTFHLDPHPAFRSAVAYPGGHIVVGGGVLALMTHEDELAIVLGHEIGHIDLGQCALRVRQAMKNHNLTPQQFDQLSIAEFGAPYGKQGELDADREGMRMAVAAGYSPNAMLDLMGMFLFLYREQPIPARTDSPSLEERVAQANQQIRENNWQNRTTKTPMNLR